MALGTWILLLFVLRLALPIMMHLGNLQYLSCPIVSRELRLNSAGTEVLPCCCPFSSNLVCGYGRATHFGPFPLNQAAPAPHDDSYLARFKNPIPVQATRFVTGLGGLPWSRSAGVSLGTTQVIAHSDHAVSAQQSLP